MFVVMGATGHIGSVVVDTLIQQGHPVLALVHSPDKVAALEAKGARTAVVDAGDADALRAAFSLGRRAFLLNPPADPSTDTDAEETATVRAILAALEGSGLEKVVAESTMGAQTAPRAGEGLGDLSVLHELERGLKTLSSRTPSGEPGPAMAVNRGAYYFSNFDLQIDAVRDTGQLHTMFPVDFALPMIAPADLGRAAARRLTSGLDDTGPIQIEGPARLTHPQVAQVFSDVLGRPVTAVATPREGWIEAFKSQGFSPSAAKSYARMTAATVDQPIPDAAETEKGETTLQAYLRDLIAR